MRITNFIILNRSLQSIRSGQQESARIERQIVTGERHQRISDAPLDARSVLQMDAQLRAGEQYVRNIGAARVRLAIADSTTESVTNILTRARELAIQHGSDTSNAEGRLAAQVEVRELRSAVIQLANRTHNGAHVFGGDYADLPPLDAAGALNPTSPARGGPRYEIGPGILADGAPDAGQLFIDSDVIGALDAIDTALGANDRSAIQASSTRLGDAIGNVQTMVAEVGARQIRLDLAEDQQGTVDVGIRARRSTLMDTSVAEAVSRLATVQSALQASLVATNRLLETTLVNFLR